MAKNIAVHTFYYTHMQFETMVKSMKEAGLPVMELYANAPHLCEMYTYAPGQREELLAQRKALLDANGVGVTCLFAPTMDNPVNIADANEEIRTFSLGWAKRLIEDAKVLGAAGVVLDSGWGLFDRDRQSAWDRSAAALKELAAYAEEQGVELYLRPVGPTTNLVNDQASLGQMVEEVSSPALKVCADLSMMVGEESIDTYLAQFGKKVGYVRLGNFSAAGELVMGQGMERLTGLLDTLEKAGYEGTVAIEVAWERLDVAHSASVSLAQQLAKL